jgi:hypothetical protein
MKIDNYDLSHLPSTSTTASLCTKLSQYILLLGPNNTPMN